jgi:hypothetical protein
MKKKTKKFFKNLLKQQLFILKNIENHKNKMFEMKIVP